LCTSSLLLILIPKGADLVLNVNSIEKLKTRFLKPKLVLLYSIIPFIILIFVFSYVPLFGWVFSFFDYRPGMPLEKQQFVGLYNFALAFDKFSGFYNALRNTIVLNVLGLIASPLPIAFAIMLAEIKQKRLSKFIQIVTSLPNFISWILVYSVFFAFFGNEGFVNSVLGNLGLITNHINLLGDVNAAWYFQTLVGIWKTLGWNAIIYIAAMSGIDQELYSAAEVDGAGRFAKIRHITIPGILPTYIVLLLLAVSNMLSNSFEQYFVFRNQLTISKLDVLDIFIYTKGIGAGQFGFATAVGMMKSVVSIGLLMFVNKLSKWVRGDSII